MRTENAQAVFAISYHCHSDFRAIEGLAIEESSGMSINRRVEKAHAVLDMSYAVHAVILLIDSEDIASSSGPRSTTSADIDQAKLERCAVSKCESFGMAAAASADKSGRFCNNIVEKDHDVLTLSCARHDVRLGIAEADIAANSGWLSYASEANAHDVFVSSGETKSLIVRRDASERD